MRPMDTSEGIGYVLEGPMEVETVRAGLGILASRFGSEPRHAESARQAALLEDTLRGAAVDQTIAMDKSFVLDSVDSASVPETDIVNTPEAPLTLDLVIIALVAAQRESDDPLMQATATGMLDSIVDPSLKEPPEDPPAPGSSEK